MSQLKSWSLATRGDLLSAGRRLQPKGFLLAANQQAQVRLGLQEDASSHNSTVDPRGQALRQLRLQQKRDAALLATQACISLRQLYQLESGDSSLFYSAGLRNQAGRRIAALLGTCWDHLGTPSAQPAQERLLKLVTPSQTSEPAPALAAA